MSAPASAKTSERLPPTLSDVYRTYKRGTSIVIDWLVSFDLLATPNVQCSPEEEEKIPAAELTVRQIAERARKAASMGKKPPVDIQMAFKTVILNRSKLTRYYEALPSSTQAVQDSTQRHKVFNETLAEAYALLMPKSRQKKKKSSKSASNASNASPDVSTPATTNSFEALIGLIEVEEGLDVSATEYWQDSLPSPSPVRSAIVEDPIEDAIATATYLAELQAIVEITKTIWKSFAAGDISLTTAGWLTNLAQYFVGRLYYKPEKPVSCERGLFRAVGDSGGLRLDITADELASADLSGYPTTSSFVELTQGAGLLWPSTVLDALFETGETPQGFENERRRFESFFPNSSEEQKTKEDFAQAITEFASTEGCQLPESDRSEAGMRICADRYAQDRLLLASMVKSVTQHPAYDAYEPGSRDPKVSPRNWSNKQGFIQHPLALPLMHDIKEKVVTVSSLVIAHMLIESGRSFVHECENMGKTPPNCRIMVLSRANEMLRAVSALHAKDGPNIDFHRNTNRCLALTRLHMDKFLADKKFDLYSQSPWVMGSYMCAMTDFALWIGLEILNDQDIFGAVMHVYNILQQIDVECPQIPLLEHLCVLFNDVLFAGKQRPRAKFTNVFELFCGAKIIQKLTESHTILGPAPRKEPRQAFSADKRLGIREMGLYAQDSFANLYCPTPQLWAKLSGDPNITRRLDRDKGDRSIYTDYPPSELVRRAQDIIAPEYEGTSPIARLNCFAVLRLCSEILLAIAASCGDYGPTLWDADCHSHDRSGVLHIHKDINSAMTCVRMLMAHVDGAALGNRKQWKRALREEPLVVMTRDAVVKVCEGRKLEDFLWQNY